MSLSVHQFEMGKAKISVASALHETGKQYGKSNFQDIQNIISRYSGDWVVGDKLYKTSSYKPSYAIDSPGFMCVYDEETDEYTDVKMGTWKFVVTKVTKHYVTIEYKYYQREGTVRLKKRKERLYYESLREKYSGVTIDCVCLKMCDEPGLTLYRVVDEKENVRKTDGVERLFHI